MKFLRTTAIVFCIALIGAACSPSAKADAWDRKTEITFNEPVEIPGVHMPGFGMLPAGTYVFRILDSLHTASPAALIGLLGLLALGGFVSLRRFENRVQ